MTPVDALEYVRSRRPRVLLAPSQWKVSNRWWIKNLLVKENMFLFHNQSTFGYLHTATVVFSLSCFMHNLYFFFVLSSCNFNIDHFHITTNLLS